MPSSTIRRRDSQRRAQQARITDDLRTANRYEDGENAITTDMKSIKGPSMKAKANRDVAKANMNARVAAYKGETKREELRTANRHKWSDASPASESRAEKNPKQFDTLVKHKRNPGRANAVASRAAGSKPVTESKRRIAKAANSIPGLGAMLPKSTGPAKKSTRARKTSK